MKHPDPHALTEPARLDIEHLSAGYNGLDALIDIHLQIPFGQQVAVVGPNGAGKSTLFKVLVGLLPIRAGTVRIHCRPIGQHRDCVAYLPQREEVDWKFPVSVRDVVAMGRFSHVSWTRRLSEPDQDIITASLEQMGLRDLADTPVGDLSGGQQQRAFLARALAQKPHVLLMDEPFNGIDAATTEATLKLLASLHEQTVTVLVSTHDLNLAATAFDRVLLLNKRLIAYGSPDEVLTREHLGRAFGERLVDVGGTILVDDCCPPDGEHQHEKGDHA
jgi:manganese/iron transport system ATP-binding protein